MNQLLTWACFNIDAPSTGILTTGATRTTPATVAMKTSKTVQLYGKVDISVQGANVVIFHNAMSFYVM